MTDERDADLVGEIASLRAHLEAAGAEVERVTAERDKARQALSLARSIAACGERVLPADEAMFDAALSPRSRSGKRWHVWVDRMWRR